MLYIHIPFCKQACHYCNFHFTTAVKYQDRMVAAIQKELMLQQQFLKDPLDSIYFGGGTPSFLTENLLHDLLNTIHRYFPIGNQPEITLEANPDDLSIEKLTSLKSIGINRLSIGIQSFYDDELQWMNRAHHSAQAIESLDAAFSVGFKDVTIDLIYGLPMSDDNRWATNMEKAFSFPINHLSAYALTVEPKTALAHFIRKGQYKPMNDQLTIRQFDSLMEAAKSKGWAHYEISNFALPEKYSRHNTAYWQGKPYLGVGPSAHSFNGHSRQWNIAVNHAYMKSIEGGSVPFEREVLSLDNRYNEHVMTGLRTQWGVKESDLAGFGLDYYAHFQALIKSAISEKKVVYENKTYRLTDFGKHFADGIAASVFK